MNVTGRNRRACPRLIGLLTAAAAVTTLNSTVLAEDGVSPPTVSGVVVHDGGSVDITFSQPMGEGVGTPENYTLSGSGAGTLTAHPAVVVQLSGSVFRLSWDSGEMKSGGDITVSVANVFDQAGLALGSLDSATAPGAAIGEPPAITYVFVSDASSVEVTFSEHVKGDVTQASSYTLSGSGQGTFAPHPDTVTRTARATYRLTWNAGKMYIGGDITVAVANVTDLAGNPLAPPGSGTTIGTGYALRTVMTLSTDSPGEVNGPIRVTLTANEPLKQVDFRQLSATNASISSPVPDGDGYSFMLTPIADGPFQLRAPAGTATDLAGNASAPSNILSGVFDRTPPVVTAVVLAPPGFAAGTEAVFTVFFSETVTGFDSPDDVTVNELSVTHTDVSVIASRENQYEVRVSGIGGSGGLSLSVPAGVAQDAAGNLNLAFGPSFLFTILQPELETLVVSSPDTAVAGNEIEFQLQVANWGNADARAVVVAIPLPAGADFVSADRLAEDPATAGPLNANVADGLLTVAVGDLPVGESASFRLVLLPTEAGDLTLAPEASSMETLSPAAADGPIALLVDEPPSTVAPRADPPLCGAPGPAPLLGLLAAFLRRGQRSAKR